MWASVICRAVPQITAILLLAFPAAAQSDSHKVVDVPTAKMLVLENGEQVRLAAIQAPNNGEPLSQQAHTALQRYALNQMVRLDPVGKGSDRRGRIVAMAYAGDIWLQQEMLREGMAWVYTFNDSRAYAAALLAAEHEAEAAKRGVWAEAAYAVLTPKNTAKYLGKFRLVEGKIAKMAEIRGNYYLNFGDDWRTDFTLLIEKESAKNFDPAWLKTLAGRTVRARGWLFEKNGPAIALSHPEQMEIRNETSSADADIIDMALPN